MIKKLIAGLMILASMTSFIACGDTNSASIASDSNDKKQETKQESKKEDTKKYSFDKFMQVQMGMTYDQVKGILGDGTEESSAGDGDTKTISYSWKNSDGSNISVMLQGGKVMTKAQAFLKSIDAKVTMEKYNKISNGMSYDQVKAVLGEGELTSQTQIMDTKGEIYSWINSNGSNMNVTFQNGAVDSKAQFELK